LCLETVRKINKKYINEGENKMKNFEQGVFIPEESLKKA